MTFKYNNSFQLVLINSSIQYMLLCTKNCWYLLLSDFKTQLVKDQ